MTNKEFDYLKVEWEKRHPGRKFESLRFYQMNEFMAKMQNYVPITTMWQHCGLCGALECECYKLCYLYHE